MSWIKTQDIRNAVVTAAKLASTLDFSGKTFKVDTISESTGGNGVVIDGVRLRDNFIAKTALPPSAWKFSVVAGGAAGNHTLTGITTADSLLGVIYVAGAGVDATDISDIRSEFTITAANTINNAAGTDTTGGKLLVAWLDVA